MYKLFYDISGFLEKYSYMLDVCDILFVIKDTLCLCIIHMYM